MHNQVISCSVPTYNWSHGHNGCLFLLIDVLRGTQEYFSNTIGAYDGKNWTETRIDPRPSKMLKGLPMCGLNLQKPHASGHKSSTLNRSILHASD